MKRLSMLLVLLVLALGSATPARAWDELGHRVIARIAWDRMTPGARDRAIELLMAPPPRAGLADLLPRDGRPMEERRAEWFTRASYWPDLIRSERHPGHEYGQSDAHYVNQFWEQTAPGAPARPRPDVPLLGELLNRLDYFRGTLGNPAVPDTQQAIDLAWTLHLVGDVHQPLHNSARMTRQEPEGDRGGNLFRLAGKQNLHSYWDGAIGPAFPWMRGDRDEAGYIARIARTIERQHPPAESRIAYVRTGSWIGRAKARPSRGPGSTPRGCGAAQSPRIATARAPPTSRSSVSRSPDTAWPQC